MSTFYDYGRWSVELSRSITGRWGLSQPGRGRKPGALDPGGAGTLSRPGVF